MATITFESRDVITGRTNTTILQEDLTWNQVAEEFFSFLLGCGYVLTRDQFASYWASTSPKETLNDTYFFINEEYGGCHGGVSCNSCSCGV